RNVPDLEVAYRALTLDDAVAAASAEAEERGKQRGRRERHHSSASGSPWGAPSIRPPHLGGVESLQEPTDEQVLADPDIQRAMSGEEECSNAALGEANALAAATGRSVSDSLAALAPAKGGDGGSRA